MLTLELNGMIIWHNLLFQKIIGESDLVEKYVYEFSEELKEAAVKFLDDYIISGDSNLTKIGAKFDVELITKLRRILYQVMHFL